VPGFKDARENIARAEIICVYIHFVACMERAAACCVGGDKARACIE
jgi:hypothetical protein